MASLNRLMGVCLSEHTIRLRRPDPVTYVLGSHSLGDFFVDQSGHAMGRYGTARAEALQ